MQSASPARLWSTLLLLVCFEIGAAPAANCDKASGAAAVSACEKELARDPDNIEVRLRYADVLIGQHQYQRAAEILKEALKMRPGNETVKRKYRFASSMAEEQQSIDRQPDTPAAGTSNSLNVILCKTLKGKRALKACGKVLKTDPRNITALTRLGDELMAINKVKDAVASYRRAVNLDPANALLKRKLKTAEAKIPAKDRVKVARSKKPIENSKPKPYTPPVKPPPVKKKADTSTVAIAEPTIEKPPAKITPASIQRYSNAPASPGVTF